MKQIIPIVATVVLTLIAQACKQEPSYSIKGSINVDSGTIYLQRFENKTFFVIDSAKIEKGAFHFAGSVARPDLFGLTIDRDENFSPYYIFIENGPISVAIDTANTRSAQIAGSQSQALFETFKSQGQSYNIDSLIAVNPTSPVAAYILYRHFANQLSAEEIDARLDKFDSSLHDLSYVIELKKLVDVKKRVEIGNSAIDFSSFTPDGKEIQLSDFYGNYLLLDFWASWCPSCRQENPNLVKTYRQYQAQGFQILAVSLDKNKEKWFEAIKKDSLAFHHVSDLKFWGSEPAKLYGIRSIPSNVLIDPSGKIIARNLYGEELGQKLRELYSVQK